MKYDGMTQGPSLGIYSHDIDDSGNPIAPGQRCKLTQGDNEILLDRVLLDIIGRHMDRETLAS